MTTLTIYHNPRCSKSRQTLQLLQTRGIEPRVVEYLKSPPDIKTLDSLVNMLGIEPYDLIRKTEPLFKELNLESKKGDRQALLQAMAAHPILIERPIVVKGSAARLGRPPEKVLELL